MGKENLADMLMHAANIYGALLPSILAQITSDLDRDFLILVINSPGPHVMSI